MSHASAVPVVRPVLAAFLLAVLAVGGVVLPVAHDVAHAEAPDVVETAHADGHHHHEVADAHGVEAQPVCPEAVDPDLACALCQVHVAASMPSTPCVLSTPPPTFGAPADLAAHAPAGAASRSRGPPLSIA